MIVGEIKINKHKKNQKNQKNLCNYRNTYFAISVQTLPSTN